MDRYSVAVRFFFALGTKTKTPLAYARDSMWFACASLLSYINARGPRDGSADLFQVVEKVGNINILLMNKRDWKE